MPTVDVLFVTIVLVFDLFIFSSTLLLSLFNSFTIVCGSCGCLATKLIFIYALINGLGQRNIRKWGSLIYGLVQLTLYNVPK